MKKSALILLLVTGYSFLYGQETIFFETCGKTDVSTPKKVDVYTGWDNSAPVVFTRTTTLDGTADVRSTSTTTNHVWFPSGKSSDLIIRNIPAATYRHLKLAFDIAAYKLDQANVNNLTLYCNGKVLTLPSVTFTSSKFTTVTGIDLTDSDAITLQFEYTAENNTSGYRIDNITLTGEKDISDVHTTESTGFIPIITANAIRFPFLAEGTTIMLFNTLGTTVQSSVLKGGYISINRNIPKGLYLVRAGSGSWKIML